MDKKKLEEDINLLYEELSKEEIHVRHDVKYSNLIDRKKQSGDWQKNYTKITSKILNYYRYRGIKGEGLVWGEELFRTIDKCIIHYRESQNEFDSFFQYLDHNTKIDKGKTDNDIILSRRPSKIWKAIEKEEEAEEQRLKRTLTYSELVRLGLRLGYSEKSAKNAVLKNYQLNMLSFDFPVGDSESEETFGDLYEDKKAGNLDENAKTENLDENSERLINQEKIEQFLAAIDNSLKNVRKGTEDRYSLVLTFLLLEKTSFPKEWFVEKHKTHSFINLNLVEDYFEKLEQAKSNHQTLLYTQKELSKFSGISEQRFIDYKKKVKEMLDNIQNQFAGVF